MMIIVDYLSKTAYTKAFTFPRRSRHVLWSPQHAKSHGTGETNFENPISLFGWNTSSLSGQLLGILVTQLITTLSKDSVKVILGPSDVWTQTGKLPDAIDLLVPMLVRAMSMALDKNLGSGLVLVLLMWNTQLVPANDFCIGNLLPLGRTTEVLSHQSLITENFWVGSHLDEFISWHCFPEFVQEGSVVDTEGWGNNL